MKTDSDFSWPILAFIIILTILVRFLPVDSVFDQGNIYFFDGDCSLHLRNIFLHIENFPSFVTFDYYNGYPVGTSAIAPPLLDYMLSVISLLVGLGNPTVRQVEVIAAVAPPFISALTVLAVYFYAKNLFNPKIALIASALLAVMPANFVFSIVGRPDNEMMEPLMTTILFFSYLRMQTTGASQKGSFSVVFRASIAALLSLLFWRGSTLWIMLVGFGVLLDITMDFCHGNAPGNRHFHGAGLFILLSLYLFFFCIFNVWGNQNTFSFNIISWFHVIVFSATAVCILAYGFLCAYWLKRNLNKIKLLLFMAALATMVFSTLFFLSASFRDNVVEGMGIIGIGNLDPWIQSIGEYQPLISWKEFSFSKSAKIFGWVFWIFPLIIGYMAYEVHKKGGDRGKIFYLVVSVLLLAFTLLRSRFQHILAISIAISSGWLLIKVYQIVDKKMDWRPRIVASATTLLLVAIFFYPIGIGVYSLRSNNSGFSIKGYVQDAMLWLRDNTPASEAPYDPKIKPLYSVMARWDFGGWIAYHAERPVVATLYGSETYGLKESVAFYLAENEAETNSIMDKTNAKYVLAVNVIGTLDTFANIMGMPQEDYVQIKYDPKFRRKVYQPGKKYYSLISTGLLFADGINMRLGNLQFKGTDHYRLVYESKERLNLLGFPFQVKKLKIFEYLTGASLKVTTHPGRKVSVVSKVRTNRNRIFMFTKKGLSGTDGSITFILPYAKLNKSNAVGLIEPYTIYSGGKSSSLNLSEKDLLEGKRFEIEIH